MIRKKQDTIESLTAESDEISITSDDNTRTIVLGGGKLESLKRHLESQSSRPEVIKEAVIVDGAKLTAKFTVETPSGTDSTTRKSSYPVHDDLRNAFAKLRDHLGRLCFQPLTEHNPAHKDNKELPALVCNIFCTGFKLSGNEETESVTLFGSRTLPNAKSIDLQSPAQKWNGDIFDYEHSNDLSEIIQECIGEVELYLFEDKHAPDNQLSLFPDEEQDNDDLPE